MKRFKMVQCSEWEKKLGYGDWCILDMDTPKSGGRKRKKILLDNPTIQDLTQIVEMLNDNTEQGLGGSYEHWKGEK